MKQKMLKTIFIMVVGIVVYFAFQSAIEVAAQSCAPGSFCGGYVSPVSVLPGGQYTLSCDYGYSGNGIYAVPGSGSCTYSNFTGTTANFKCTAGNVAGTFNNSCKLSNPSPYTFQTDAVNSITIATDTTTEVTPPPTTTPPGTSVLPTPPSDAKVFSNIDEMTGWGSCGTKSCAGGGSDATSFPMVQNQSTPSLDGKSISLSITGSSYSNALWWKKLGANNAASNFLWDSYFYVDNSVITNAQTSEFDIWQSIGGYNYMVGSQCNYQAGVWDIWSQAQGSWIHTSIACPRFSVGWHHIQWYVQRVVGSYQYKYVALVVDENPHLLNIVESAAYNGWGDNLGVQYQLDLNSKGGTINEWVDKENLTIWSDATTPPTTTPPPIITPTPVGGGGGGGSYTPPIIYPASNPVVITTPTSISGCGSNNTGFSITTGQSCANNITTKETYDFGTITLRNGSRGDAVVELQEFLNDTLNLGLVLDGKLGPKTIAVIVIWQKNHNLVPDGLVGPKTKALMNAQE